MPDSYVCSGAMMRCTMGTSPAQLTVLPSRTVFLCGQPMANISDHKSMVNLAPFGLCRSLGFPATASATAAHHGVLTPMPCVHNTPAPWMPGKTDYFDKSQPSLLKSCKLQCMWGGMISIIDDGQKGESLGIEKQPKDVFPKDKDEIVVVKAYWDFYYGSDFYSLYLGRSYKMKFIPFQKPESLVVEFYYKFDDALHSKENVKLIIKNTDGVGDAKKTILINNPKPISVYNQNGMQKKLYKHIIVAFTSDMRYIK